MGGILKVFSKSRSWNILVIMISVDYDEEDNVDESLTMTKDQGRRTQDSEKGEPESGAGENPMFPDDGVCCENVETPGVDVRQDPLQFLLQEASVRNKHLRKHMRIEHVSIEHVQEKSH